MEGRTREARRVNQTQGTLGFRNTKMLQLSRHGDGKDPKLPAQSQIRDRQTWLPAHDSNPTRSMGKEKLPERLVLLEELYYSMEAAISLLRIRHSICTFSAIAAAVESSTQRRFLQSHLAQIKHILPEALQVDTHISWDPESQCSRKDLRITLLPILQEEGAKRCKSPQKSKDMVVRRREFHHRLLEFYQKNKSEMDVPEASMLKEVSTNNTESVKLLNKNTEDHQGGGSICQADEQVKADDLLKSLDGEPELSPLPVAFHASQLKKYPRSPSKLPHQHRVSPAPVGASMSHLPPIFKAHFSAKSHTASALPDGQQSSGKVSEPECPFGPSTRPPFSVKRCKNAAVPSVPSTPQKYFLQAGTQQKDVEEFSATLLPSEIASIETSSILSHSGRPRTVYKPTCETPTQSERSSARSNRFMSPPLKSSASTPHQAVWTPVALTTPAAVALSKEPLEIPAIKRKQAVKSLRFSTPTKLADHENSRLNPVLETEEATPSKFESTARLSFISPVRTPANNTFTSPKKPSGNVSRLLAFNSPARLHSKDLPQFPSQEDTTHTPKRAKLLTTEREPPVLNEDLTNVGNLYVQLETFEMAAGIDERHQAEYVDLSVTDDAEKLSASDVEILKCLPKELLNDVQAKERKQLQDAQSGVEKARKRQRLIAGLPKLFNMVRLIFQSESRTVLLRKDLVNMVLSSHPDITDKDEIIEQLQLLVDLAPQWISASKSLAGDSLFRINKNANMRVVSKALVDAKR